MRLKRVTAPTTEPVTLSELKSFLRIDSNSEDVLLESSIISARAKLESITNSSFITQKWRMVLDGIPSSEDKSAWWNGTREGALSSLFGFSKFIKLPMGPVQSIDSFKYYDVDNNEQTYDSDNYFLDDSGLVNRLVRNDNSTWPASLRTYASIYIEYITGYGTRADVPDNLKSAIKLLANHYYENRGECADSEIPSSVLTLIDCASIKRLQ